MLCRRAQHRGQARSLAAHFAGQVIVRVGFAVALASRVVNSWRWQCPQVAKIRAPCVARGLTALPAQAKNRAEEQGEGEDNQWRGSHFQCPGLFDSLSTGGGLIGLKVRMGQPRRWLAKFDF